jgi:hypothetical protein
VIDMQRGHKLTDPSALEMPERLDPAGLPCVESAPTAAQAGSSQRRHPRSLPGLAPTSLIASVEAVAADEVGDWFAWGCVDDRPVLFAVDAAAAAEMLASVTAGHMATAIIEPWQMLLERLD